METTAFRGDAASAQPNMFEYLELEGIDYAIRLPADRILQARIHHLLKRPLREKLIEIGAKVISHGRYVALQMAEGGDLKAVVRCDPAAHCRFAIASSGNGNMSTRATVYAGKRREGCVLMSAQSAFSAPGGA